MALHTSDDHSERRPAKKMRRLPTLRLVVWQSELPLIQGSSALLDPVASSSYSIGRDKSFDARIRLKELQVSKTHASVFFDAHLLAWSVVDMGSSHGTFVKSDEQSEWERLSPKKRASAHPHMLKHLGLLRIGSTVFQAHVHPDNVPCSGCSIAADASNQLSLHHPPVDPKQRTVKTTTPPKAQAKTLRNPSTCSTSKDALLLAHSDQPAKQADEHEATYIDRARLRRQQESHAMRRTQVPSNTSTRLEPKANANAETITPAFITAESSSLTGQHATARIMSSQGAGIGSVPILQGVEEIAKRGTPASRIVDGKERTRQRFRDLS